MSDLGLVILPNSERLVSQFLQGQAESGELADFISPKNVLTTKLAQERKQWPALRLMRIGGPPDEDIYWVDRPLLQVDVWGWVDTETPDPAATAGPKLTVERITARAHALLAQQLPGRHTIGADEAVVSSATVGGIAYDMDDSWPTARHHARFDMTAVVRPALTAGS